MAIIIKTLFPMMNYIYKPNNYNLNFNEYDEKMRICHPNHFKSYFKLNDSFKEITEKEINETIDLINSEKPEKYILNNLKQKSDKKLELFFEKMVNRLDRVEKREYFIDIIFLLDSEINESIYSKNSLNIRTIIVNLLYKIEITKRFNCLKENFEKNDNIIFLFELIYYIENNNHNIYVANEELLNPPDITTLKKIIENKINKLTDNELKNNLIMSLDIIEICDKFKFENRKNQIVKTLISTPENIINLLKLFFKENENKRLINSTDNLNYYIDIDKIKHKVDELPEEYKTQYPIKTFLNAYQKLNEE